MTCTLQHCHYGGKRLPSTNMRRIAISVCTCRACFDPVEDLVCATDRSLECRIDDHVILDTGVNTLTRPPREAGTIATLTLTPLELVEIAMNTDE